MTCTITRNGRAFSTCDSYLYGHLMLLSLSDLYPGEVIELHVSAKLYNHSPLNLIKSS